ncbi:ankyrin [Fusarium beomiforme]|uniref:Ankyrin n=1 Tax=Fusarium beomiforme TaxID=44412 RepID=A0A9P5AN85_9HYPO|nr:ankyrin [Fusarium beomiforme]
MTHQHPQHFNARVRYEQYRQQIVRGTGDWILTTEAMRTWEHNHHEVRHLGMQGVMGSGKSILMYVVFYLPERRGAGEGALRMRCRSRSFIVTSLLKKVGESTRKACVYFHFDHSDTTKLPVSQLWAALLEQLVRQKPADVAGQKIQSVFERSSFGSTIIHPTQYYDLFQDLASVFETVYVVIDALDLCADYHDGKIQHILYDTFQSLPDCVKVLFSSRDISLANRLGVRNNYEVRPDRHDIETYVRERVKASEKLQSLSQSDKHMKILIDTIMAGVESSHILSCISWSLSEFLEPSFKKLNQERNSSDGKLAEHVLAWVTCAKEDPSADLVIESIELSRNWSHNRDGLRLDAESLLPICHGLVTLDHQKRTLRLIHRSIKGEELISCRMDFFEVTIAQICLRLLGQKTKVHIRTTLLSYASKFWASHLQSVNPQSRKALNRLIADFLTDTNAVTRAWQNMTAIDSVSKVWSVTGLHAAAFFDLYDWIRPLSRYVDINSVCSARQTALHWAVNIKDPSNETPLHKVLAAPTATSYEIAKLLVEGGASVTIENTRGYSPLSLAIHYGPTSIAKLFIGSQKDVNAEFKRDWTSLRELFHHGHKIAESISKDEKHPLSKTSRRAVKSHLDSLADLLLEKGAKLDQPTSDGWLPLVHAAQCGSVSMLQRLLEYQPNPNLVNQRDSSGRSLLYWALYYRNWGTAQILVKHGSEVNEENDDKWQPLIEVTKINSYEMVHFLINKGAQVDRTDNKGLSALSYAVSNCSKDIIWLLTTKGANVDVPGENGSPIIEMALQHENLSIAWILCMHHADLKKRDEKGMTLLHRASRAGKLQNVAFLVDWGLETDTVDSHGWTPLHYAVLKGFETIVHLLASRITDPVVLDKPDKEGSTALILATRMQNIAMVRTLIRCGSSCELKDNKGRSAIHYAASLGFGAAVRVLIPEAKDINDQDNKLNTAIHFAVLSGKIEALHLLLEQKPNLEVVNEEGCSPLILAVITDNPTAVRELLQAGANIDTTGKNECTALDFARNQTDSRSKKVLETAIQARIFHARRS